LNAQTLQAAYVLHSRRYGDSSLIVDLLTRDEGRVACLSKGALRPRRTEATLQSFQPLLAGVRGRGDVLTLTHVESAGAALRLTGRNLYCGLYLNELLLKLTARHDASPPLFDDYVLAIRGLEAAPSTERVLRRFEVRLLEHLGLGLSLELDSRGEPISVDSSYNYQVGTGAVRDRSLGGRLVSGSTLIALRSGEFPDQASLREARGLMRRVLDHHLDGRPLRSRELFRSTVPTTGITPVNNNDK
jgi:DNA repair protein RecO (recombination protein O)